MSKQVVGYVLVAIDKKAPDGSVSQFGFLYCPELNQSVHFPFAALEGDYTTPALGDMVFVDVRKATKGLTANSVRLLHLAAEVPKQELAIEVEQLAQTLRCKAEDVVTILAELAFPVAAATPRLLTVPQVLAVRNVLELRRNKRPASLKPAKPRLPLQLGVVTEYAAEREFGFIQQAGFGDTYFRTTATTHPVRNGMLVLFMRETRAGTGRTYAVEVSPLNKSRELVQRHFRTFTSTLLGQVLAMIDQELREEILTWQLSDLLAKERNEAEQPALAHIQWVKQYWAAALPQHLEQLLPRVKPAVALEWWLNYAADTPIPEPVLTGLRQLATLDDTGSKIRWTLGRISTQQLLAYLPVVWPAEAVDQDIRETAGVNVAAFWDVALGSKPLESKRSAKQYFASLGHVELAKVLHEQQQQVLPLYDYVYAVGKQLEKAALLELLECSQGSEHLPLLVATLLIEQLPEVDVSVLGLLAIFAKQLSASDLQEVKAKVLSDALPLQRVMLYMGDPSMDVDLGELAGKLTNSELEQVLNGAGPEPELTQRVRLWAAMSLLGRLQNVSSSSWQAVFSLLKLSKRKLSAEQFELLVAEAGEVGRTWLALYNWLEAEGPTPPADTLLNFLALPEAACPFPQLRAIEELTEAELLSLLHELVDREPRELMRIETALLVAWVGKLPESEEQQRVLSRLVWTERQPLMLQLWLRGYSPYYDFARFRTLVFTLPAEQQFLFLRKTFKLIAEQQVKLTLADLNTIVRYSKEDADTMGARLDYTVDLTLATLTMLQEKRTLPQERDILDFVARQVDEDIRQLPTFVEFFEKCIGRSDRKEVRDPRADKGRAFTEEFGWIEGTSDTKRVFIDGVAYGVAGGAFYKDGKRIRVLNWQVEAGSKYIVDRAKLPAPTGVKCCEGRQADKLDNSQLPFWWCRGFPCFGPNQVEGKQPDHWKTYVLRDFIAILGLPFDHDSYYIFIGVLNRVNQLLERLNCSSCQRILRPVGQSDFNLYRVNRFHCTHAECEDKQVVYLSTCLNYRCHTIIDSRVSKRCNYHDLGYDWQGPVICANCGGCCSKQMLELRAAAIAKV